MVGIRVAVTEDRLRLRLRKRNAMRKAKRHPPTNAPTIPPARVPVLKFPLDDCFCELLGEAFAVALDAMLALEADVVVVDDIELGVGIVAGVSLFACGPDADGAVVVTVADELNSVPAVTVRGVVTPSLPVEVEIWVSVKGVATLSIP